MALQSVTNKNLLLIDGNKNEDAKTSKKKKIVLDEDTYTEVCNL